MWTTLARTAVLAGLLLASWGGYRLWPRRLVIHPVAWTPVWDHTRDNHGIVRLPGQYLIAEIGLYHDELFAYLLFQYLRGAALLRKTEILLSYRKIDGQLAYPIEVKLENDLLGSLDLMAQAQAAGLITNYEWRYVNQSALRRLQYQSQVFVAAYKMTSRRKLEHLTRAELARYVSRFVRFKSATDPRICRRIDPVPQPLTRAQASRLAADMVTVADFYSLPLEFFLGIGAMENNYMDVKGDLRHAIWKKQAAKGDVVLRRQAGRVLVLNPASGVWQITRETLRYVHSLYLQDRRDYSKLPAHLRPAKELNLDEPNPETLTTYAGLLFRHLLDCFHGDLPSAVGAYNGGPGNPNPRYETGVRMVADYARRILEHAAALSGRPAAETQFLTR